VTAIPEALIAEVRRGLQQLPVERELSTSVASVVHRTSAVIGSQQLLTTLDRVSSEVLGAGPLEPLLRLPDVTDVLVNGPGPVYVDQGNGLRTSGVVIEEERTIRRLAERTLATCGRRIDDSAPYADGRLADGTRVHAVLPPLSPGGTCLSLRVPPRRTFTLDDLVARQSMSEDAASLLRDVVRAKLAFVVTGGTGTGKTTILSTLLSEVRPEERIVLVEDASELKPAHPHVIRLEARQPNAEGAGSVTLDVLVRQALRMRPDRLVVGEARGAEVVDLLAALNTGHEGGASTVHANRSEHVPARFEALCSAAGWDRQTTHSQLSAALDAVIHLRRVDGRRVLAGLAVLTRDSADGLVKACPAFSSVDGGVVEGPGWRELRDRLRRAA
jgi:pilus assembly protein CpaF